MKYVLLLHDDEAAWTSLSEAEQGAVFEDHMAFTEALTAAAALISGEPLDPAVSGKVLRRGAVQDGPYADTKEQLGGFYVIEAVDIDAAVEWARRCPTSPSGAVEVRPVPDYGD